MSSQQIYRVAGYVPTGVGHFAAELELAPDDVGADHAGFTGTTLWSPFHDEGKEGLQRALLLPQNGSLLAQLAGQPEAKVDFCARQIGTAGDVDVVALLRAPDSAERTLLLVDCEAAGLTKPSRLRTQYVTALRNARCLLSNLRFRTPQPEPVIVLLAGWRPFMDLPRVGHRPGWTDEPVPAPHWWGYLPFRRNDAEFVAFGRWYALDGDRWARGVEERVRAWSDSELKGLRPPDRPMRQVDFPVDLGKGSGLSFLLDRGPLRARLCLASAKHRRAMLPEGKEDFYVRRMRGLRLAAYENAWAPTGWEFLGENIEDGSPLLTWQWAAAERKTRLDWGMANEEAERFAITMKMFIASI